VKTAVDGLAGKKEGQAERRGRGPVVKVGEEGVTLTVNKARAARDVGRRRPQGDGGPGQEASRPPTTTSRRSPCCGCSRDVGDAKKQSTKLTSDIGKLGEMFDASKALLPELKSARARIGAASRRDTRSRS
jgi:hypothetical protein